MENLFNTFEFFGMVFSMAGAFFMSRNASIHKNTMLKAGLSFLVANIFMIFVAIWNNLGSLTIQMILFFISSVMIVQSYSKNNNTNIYLAILTVFVFMFISVFVPGLEIEKMFESNVEMFAAIMAITGSFMLRVNSEKVKIFSFILFFLADVLYTHIAYDKSMYFFMIQSLFFLFTSSVGIVNSLSILKNCELKFAHA